MRRPKSKSYLSQPNVYSKKQRKRVIHVKNETFRRSQRLKSMAEVRVIEPSSNLKEKNTSTISDNLSQTKRGIEEHFSCSLKEKTLECKICSKAFRYQTNLKRHYRVHLQDKSFAFNESPKPLESENYQKTHYISYPLRNRIDSKILNAVKLSDYPAKEVETNPEDKLLLDSTSLQIIKQKIQLKNPTAIKEKRYFSCSTCKKSFKSNDKLNRHSIIHRGDKPFGCVTCKMFFYRKDHLKRHLKTHTEDKPFSCGTCKKAFREKDHLKRHFSIHTGDKPFSCDTCKKLFSRKDHLKKHFSVHIKGKIFSRVTHNKTFTLKSGLKNILRTHLSEKPFSCYKCSKTFKHKNHLKLHNRTHLKKDTFSCNKCEKTFKQEIYLQRHLFIHSRKNGFARNKHKSIFNCKVGVKRRLDGNFKPLDQKISKKMCSGRYEMKDYFGVCTRSKSLSSENCIKGFGHKYEQLSAVCTDNKSNYDRSPDTILEDNSELVNDLKGSSLKGNTKLTQTKENDIMIHLNTKKENYQDCCNNETIKSNHVELNKIKGTNISAFSEICTRSKSFSNKINYKDLDDKEKLDSTPCTVSNSTSSYYPALDKILKDNSQAEEKVCTDSAVDSLTSNAALTQTIKNEIIHLNTESKNSQNCCDNEMNLTHIKFNKKKKRKFSGYSEFCSRFKALSIKTNQKGFNYIYQLFNTDSTSNYFDCHTPGTTKENNRQTEGQVGIHLTENYLTWDLHLKQKIENELKRHMNSDTENFLNEKYSRNIIEFSTGNKEYSNGKSEKNLDHKFELYIKACTDSKSNSCNYSSLGNTPEDNSELEENVSANLEDNSTTCDIPLTQTVENEGMVYSNSKKENSQNCYDNETNKPNHIESDNMEGTKISANSVICTRSKTFSSKTFEKSFDREDKATTSTCTDSKTKYSSFLDKISKVNSQLEEKDCAVSAKNSIIGNTPLKQTTENELTINLNKKEHNSQECYDNETKIPHHIEKKKFEGTNISGYSAIITRSKSLSNKNYGKGLDSNKKLENTCTDFIANVSDNSIICKIRKDKAQLEEKVFTNLLENCLIDNSHLKQTMQDELMIHTDIEKDSQPVCCDNESKSPNSIELYERKEANITVYSIICSYCEEKFKRHGDLQRHLRVHRSNPISAIKTQDLK